MNKELILSLKEEPVELFQLEKFEQLIKYAETNKERLDNYWQNKNKEEIELFLKYATSKLSFFENYIESQLRKYSVFKIGKLLGAVESYENILYENQREQLIVNKIYEEGHTIKYLDDIVKLLEGHGGLTHTELCNYLSLKTSTLSEAIKKVLAMGVIEVRNSGKYKIYSLNDEGIKYGKFLRNKKKQGDLDEEIIMLLRHSLENITTEQAIYKFKEKIKEFFDIDNISIKKNQSVTLQIETPRGIEIEDVEISKIENNINKKPKIYCSLEGVKLLAVKRDQGFKQKYVCFDNKIESEKNLNFA